MPELRYNIISREWVIIARERAKRPQDFAKSAKQRAAIPDFKPDCPFCPGNEDKTPKETYRLAGAKTWKVRVTYNKFPALSVSEPFAGMKEGIFRSVAGFGIHEVIIDSPRHNGFIPQLTVAEIADIIATYRQRYIAVQQLEHIEAVIIFKNHGSQAGTSLEHPHSQLIATPIVPPQLRSRIAAATQYFDETGKCIFCRMLEEELRAKERIVAQTDEYVCFIPYAALSPFHMWIFPRRHAASFSGIQDKEITDLARILRATVGKLHQGLDNPDYNYTIHSAPVRESAGNHFHWYISIIPRISKIAGFELGSGIFINVSSPEESAAFLRNIPVD